MLFCQNHPPLHLVLAEYQKCIKKLPRHSDGSLIRSGFDKKHKPDIKWALLALATLDPNHIFFKPGYKYEKPIPQ